MFERKIPFYQARKVHFQVAAFSQDLVRNKEQFVEEILPKGSVQVIYSFRQSKDDVNQWLEFIGTLEIRYWASPTAFVRLS